MTDGTGDTDRDFSPTRIKHGTPLSRRFFRLLGIESARSKRERDADE